MNAGFSVRTGGVIAASLLSMTGCATYGNFSLSSLEGRQSSLKEHRGKVVMLSFFALG